MSDPFNETPVDGLNPDQRAAYDGIVALFQDEGPASAILSGSAGTGKTFLTSALSIELNPLLCAMTHKAAAVMSKATGQDVSTLAKVLKQKKVNDLNTGEVQFQSTGEVKIKQDTIFIDEASMTNEDNFKQIEQFLAPNYNVLYIGDTCQLPPVKEDVSAALTADLPHFELNIIMRSQPDTGVQLTGIAVRRAILKNLTLVPGMDHILENHDDVTYVKEQEAFEAMVNDFRNMKDVNDLRMISFTNRRVEDFNRRIKEAVTGEAEMLCHGDVLVSNNSYVKDKNVIVQNNESILVSHIHEGEHLDTPCYFITCTKGKDIPVPLDRLAYAAKVKRMVGEACQHKSGSMERRKAFRDKFLYEEAFADLRVNYAQTVHKSQGSTYKTCYYDMTGSSPRTDLGRKLLYTGVTRASEKLVLFR